MKWLIAYFLLLAVCMISSADGGGKIYEPKDPKYGTKKNYTNQQKINRGTNASKKIYTTCRLMKRLKSRTTGRQVVYIKVVTKHIHSCMRINVLDNISVSISFGVKNLT